MESIGIATSPANDCVVGHTVKRRKMDVCMMSCEGELVLEEVVRQENKFQLLLDDFEPLLMELVKQQQCQVSFTAAEMEPQSGAGEICESECVMSAGTGGDRRVARSPGSVSSRHETRKKKRQSE